VIRRAGGGVGKIYYDIDWRFNVWSTVLGVQKTFVIPHLPAGELIGF